MYLMHSHRGIFHLDSAFHRLHASNFSQSARKQTQNTMFGCLLFECDDQATIATYIFLLRLSVVSFCANLYLTVCSFSSFLNISSRLDSKCCNCEEIEFAYSKGENKDLEILFTFFK